MTIPTGATFDLGCTNIDAQGSLLMDSGQIINADSIGIGVLGVLEGGSGSISVGGNWDNSGTFIPGTSTVVFADGCSVTPAQLTGNTTFHNLTLISTNGRTFVFPAGSNITVNGTLTLQGAPGLPIQLVSSSGQAAVIALGPNAQVVRSNANASPNVQIGAISSATAIPTLNEYGLMILALLLAAMAARQIDPSPFARRMARGKSHREENHGK
ncbi:MAG: IPTL-CTERM sorting domain-containing protein [Candidatus Nitrotoga sp.]